MRRQEQRKPNSSRQRGLVGVIRLFHGLYCEIGIFQNGKVNGVRTDPAFKSHTIFVVKLPLSTKLKCVSGTFKFCESFILYIYEGSSHVFQGQVKIHKRHKDIIIVILGFKNIFSIHDMKKCCETALLKHSEGHSEFMFCIFSPHCLN